MQRGLAWLRGTTQQGSGEDMTWEYRERVGIPTVAAGGPHGVLGPLDSSSPCGSALPSVHPCTLSPPAPAAHRVGPAPSHGTEKFPFGKNKSITVESPLPLESCI